MQRRRRVVDAPVGKTRAAIDGIRRQPEPHPVLLVPE